MTTRLFLIVATVLLCGHKLAFSMEVALIGDKSKQSAFHQIALDTKSVQTKADGVLRATTPDKKTTFSVADTNSQPFQIANQVLTADIALLVVDSTQGPLPSVREQLIIARQARVPQIAIYFSNTRTLQKVMPKDAAELLELEEMEMRELMDRYEMGGGKAEVFFDGEVRKVSKHINAFGTNSLLDYLARSTAKRDVKPLLRQTSEFNCYYYLLSNPEANGRGVTLTNRSSVDVWIEGSNTTGLIQSSTTHKPGDDGEFSLTLASPIKAAEGSRVLLVRNGQTVGVGVVKSIVR